MSAPRVLCYAPHNRWVVHGQWDMTIVHGLRHRGADVRYVMCDGLFSDCDVHWEAWGKRPADACLSCQAGVAKLAADNQMPYEWLGRSLEPKQAREARRWVSSLGRDELLDAVYGDWPIAIWVKSSIHSNFRRSHLDVTDPEVERVTRSYLYSGLVAAFALDFLLEDYDPEVLLVFNGRQSSTRVAFELAQRRGIRVVCHERGPRKGSMWLTADLTINARAQFVNYWADWSDIPLTLDELGLIRGHFAEREHGINTGSQSFSPAPQDHHGLRAELGLHANRPVWALFTSSDDEVVAEPEWQATWTQAEWVAQTTAYARLHPEIDLVVRVHPNTGSRRSIGTNVNQLAELNLLRADLPANVRWVAPDDQVSSYTLMELATVGVVSHSTVGLEMACKGKAVIVAAPNPVSNTSFVRTAEDPDTYGRALDEALAIEAGTIDADVRRLAYRWAFGRFYRMAVEFPLVNSRQDSVASRAWGSPAELVPGRDASLDRCTAIVLGEQPVCLPPGAADRARDPELERRALAPLGGAVVLAYAEELIADAGLLETWRDSFGAADEATLVIHTPAHATEELIAAVGRAGLDSGDVADMVAVGDDADELTAVVAVLSRHEDAGLPRLDTVAALRALAA
jgi:hypothetical protein